MNDSWLRWDGDTLALDIKVQPCASQIGGGVHAGHLKVRLTATAQRGKANEQLRRFLANQFGVPNCQVRLQSGTNTRAKRILIQAPVRHPRWLAAKVDTDEQYKTG